MLTNEQISEIRASCAKMAELIDRHGEGSFGPVIVGHIKLLPFILDYIEALKSDRDTWMRQARMFERAARSCLTCARYFIGCPHTATSGEACEYYAFAYDRYARYADGGLPDIVCWRAGGRAFVAGVAQAIVRHSPDGFEWGYGGSGPADLALNILAQHLPEDGAERLCQEFKRRFVEPLPRGGGAIRRADIIAWVEAHSNVSNAKPDL